MEEPKFKIGDLVELNSGSPPLTVMTPPTATEEKYYVTWFNDLGQSRQGFLHPAMIKAHDPVAYHRRREQAILLAANLESKGKLQKFSD